MNFADWLLSIMLSYVFGIEGMKPHSLPSIWTGLLKAAGRCQPDKAYYINGLRQIDGIMLAE